MNDINISVLLLLRMLQYVSNFSYVMHNAS